MVLWIGTILFVTQNQLLFSESRTHFVVKGPKVDGSYFGYGFPMMPGATKKERWTVGTKVYRINRLGLRKLLVEIKAEDEGQVVKLFDSQHKQYARRDNSLELFRFIINQFLWSF